MSGARATFGPAYDSALDSERVSTQMLRVRELMLSQPDDRWLTLAEIERKLEFNWPHCFFPQASVSAQLRHLRKAAFGSYRLLKRRRASLGLWEYRLLPPEPPSATQRQLFVENQAGH